MKNKHSKILNFLLVFLVLSLPFASAYHPYGEVLSGDSDRFTFTGQELDLSGLMYYGARYYDPELSQFIQPDTLIQDLYNPQNLNRYSYVLNNPYKYTDPTGHVVWDVVDISLAALDINSFIDDPSLGNVFWAGLSVVSLLPILPNVAGYVRYGEKAADKVTDAVKATNKVAKTSDKVVEIGEYQYKHVQKRLSEEKLLKSTAQNPKNSLFSNTMDYKNVVNQGFKEGTKIHEGLKVFDAQKTVGYSKGKPTNYIAVRSNDLGKKIDIHGYPISEKEYLDYLKKAQK